MHMGAGFLQPHYGWLLVDIIVLVNIWIFGELLGAWMHFFQKRKIFKIADMIASSVGLLMFATVGLGVLAVLFDF